MELIGAGDLNTVFAELKKKEGEFTPEQEQEFITYSFQFSDLNRQIKKKTIDPKDIERIRAGIVQNLINFVENLE